MGLRAVNIEKLRIYAENSAKWENGGGKTEDELLQRIWNLSSDVRVLCEEVERLEGFCERYDHWMLETAKVLGFPDDGRGWGGQDPSPTSWPRRRWT